MSDFIIQCDNLGKRYAINSAAPRERYIALRDVLANQARSLVRRARRGLRPPASVRTREEAFWALRDVSFEVKRGDAVGIIGRNGAGKSTLLKILSRITEPSAGRVRLRGRVASLLEVGTGFHPELTGRENIYLNGSILGMRRAEIKRKFDEIVAFAEVETFLDTPVKRYSSGMYVRLAFAVAAHLDPDILVVDEVLAVGDHQFQEKCLGKMQNVASTGRTVLFVSHNLPSINRLCDRAILLARGRTVDIGECASVVDTYLRNLDGTCAGSSNISDYRDASMEPVVQAVEIVDSCEMPCSHISAGGSLAIRIRYSSDLPLRRPRFGIQIENQFGEPLVFLRTLHNYGEIATLPARGTIECRIRELPLAPGTYRCTVGCSIPERQLDVIRHLPAFTVVAADFFGTGHLPAADQGHLLLRADWVLPSHLAETKARSSP